MSQASLSTMDIEMRELVLQNFTGINLIPRATIDAEGELASPAESGSLHIDNIYFF